MREGFIETAARVEAPDDRRLYSVAPAKVINNIDTTGQGRVQVHLPWSGLEPWARVAVPMAGMSRGTYFIPQEGDEVLVAFHHGDVRDPYIVGSLWNGQDLPPTLLPTDAINKRIIRTPLGHEVEFDDATQTITITSITQQKVTIEPQQMELTTAGNTATITLDTAGTVSIQATRRIELKAQTITIEGGVVDIKGSTRTSINGGPACDIQAGTVRIN